MWRKEKIQTLAGLDDDISNEIVKLSDLNNGVVELELNDYDLNRFDLKSFWADNKQINSGK